MVKIFEKIAKGISAVGLRDSRNITHIILHHSLTNGGGASQFRKYHVNFLGWKAMAYDIVINKDGRVELGERWFYKLANDKKQLEIITGFYSRNFNQHGKAYLMAGIVKHYKAAGEWRRGMNRKGMHICLVGNFDKYPPSDLQLSVLKEFLFNFSNAFSLIFNRRLTLSRHCDFNINKTCPGKLFPFEALIKDLKYLF